MFRTLDTRVFEIQFLVFQCDPLMLCPEDRSGSEVDDVLYCCFLGTITAINVGSV